jgi:two-component system, LytTR family, response regulator
MKQYSTLIVDDEAHSRGLLRQYLEKYAPEIQIQGEAKSVAEAFEKTLFFKPDIVFLDISLINETVFDLLEKFKDIHFEIIFITAFNEFAIKAIKFSAIDYLLKPINIEQLVQSVHKAIKRIEEKSTLNHFKYLTENLSRKEQIHKIALPTIDGYIFVSTDHIIHCKASGSYTEFYFTNRKPLIISKGLKEYEELLEENHFVRVHHSHLINLMHVTSYQKGKSPIITMCDDSKIEVSVRKKDEFLERLQRLKA